MCFTKQVNPLLIGDALGLLIVILSHSRKYTCSVVMTSDLCFLPTVQHRPCFDIMGSEGGASVVCVISHYKCWEAMNLP